MLEQHPLHSYMNQILLSHRVLAIFAHAFRRSNAYFSMLCTLMTANIDHSSCA